MICYTTIGNWNNSGGVIVSKPHVQIEAKKVYMGLDPERAGSGEWREERDLSVRTHYPMIQNLIQ
jgi:hypothetical protein